jgi:hypothetical protein
MEKLPMVNKSGYIILISRGEVKLYCIPPQVKNYCDGNFFVIIPMISNTKPMDMAESAQLKAGQW